MLLDLKCRMRTDGHISSRYEDLKRQLEEAQQATQAEDEQAELARATAAVARLTAPAALTQTSIEVAEDIADASAARNGASRRKVIVRERRLMQASPVRTNGSHSTRFT